VTFAHTHTHTAGHYFESSRYASVVQTDIANGTTYFLFPVTEVKVDVIRAYKLRNVNFYPV